jgi:HlyD family type I secretion membrane fusion protein
MPVDAQDQLIPRWVSPAGAAWLGSASLLILMLWAAWAEVEVVIAAPASARPAGGTVAVRAPASGRVSAVLAADGDSVTAGQLLVVLGDGAGDKRWHASAVALEQKHEQLETLRTVSRLLDDGAPLDGDAPEAVRLRVEESRRRVAKLDDELRALGGELTALHARAAASRQLLRIRQERHRAAEQAFGLGALSRFELLRIWQETLSQRAELQAVLDQVVVMRARIRAQQNAAREILAADRRALASALEAAEVEVAELEAARAEVGDRREDRRIVAQMGGVVEQLALAIGQPVERGETLAMLVPTGRPLLFETRVAPGQAAFLHPGQSCRIKLDALPFARYGSLGCRVETVSHDVVSGDGGPGHYLVRVRPAAEQLQADGRPVRLQPGATAWVDIVAGRRTVLSFVTEPLRRFAAESLRER